MSAWEGVPEESEADWSVMNDVEREIYLSDVYRELRDFAYRRKDHDQDGWWADDAGSDKCRALGHEEADWDNDETHPSSFDGEPLCYATRHGSLCTVCEGECYYDYDEARLLWSSPGVQAPKDK